MSDFWKFGFTIRFLYNNILERNSSWLSFRHFEETVARVRPHTPLTPTGTLQREWRPDRSVTCEPLCLVLRLKVIKRGERELVKSFLWRTVLVLRVALSWWAAWAALWPHVVLEVPCAELKCVPTVRQGMDTGLSLGTDLTPGLGKWESEIGASQGVCGGLCRGLRDQDSPDLPEWVGQGLSDCKDPNFTFPAVKNSGHSWIR